MASDLSQIRDRNWDTFVARVMRLWDTRRYDTKDISKELMISEHVVMLALRTGKDRRLFTRSTDV